MTLMGADIDQLHGLGAKLLAQPDIIRGLMDTVTQALGNTRWDGPSRERFEADWNQSFLPALKGLGEAFVAAGNECQKRSAALQQLMS